ncbi:MAG: hypothetical protein A2017_18575 [Lentisphaerae bacterium GWF2_44_16]|nr:MAG: hypothetical protein A2017_18575 [Lentisphaerae bacterium GWF2_44_16]
MEKETCNHKQMRKINRSAVLNHLRQTGPRPRAEIARDLKMDGTTITHLVRELLKEKLLCVQSIGRSSTGKPQDLLDINPDGATAAGISLAPGSVSGVILNLKGEVISREHIMTSHSISRQKLMGFIEKIIENILSHPSNQSLRELGVAYHGIFPVKEKSSLRTLHLPALEGLDIKSRLKEKYGFEPRLISATRAVAEAEMWLGNMSAAPDFCIVDLGVGIGSVNISSGVIQYGTRGLAGELGHTKIIPDGEKCLCGHFGCLETVASINAIEKKTGAALKRDIHFDEIVHLFKSGNKTVKNIISNAAKYLAIATGNMINLHNPSKLIFSGLLMELGEPFFDEIKLHISESALPELLEDTILQRSSLGDYSPAIGAAVISIKDIFAIH